MNSKDFTLNISLPDNKCPKCNCPLRKLGGITQQYDTVEPGDFSVCINCGEILVFDNNMRSQICSSNDLDELAKGDLEAYVAILKAQAIIRAKIKSGEWK